MRSRVLVALCLVLGCSNVLQEEEVPGCESDDDCEGGQVCSVDQGNVCVDKDEPRRGALGLVIREPATGLTVEITGCEADLPQDGNLVLRVDRDDVWQRFDFGVTDTRDVAACTQLSGCLPGYGCVEEGMKAGTACVGLFDSNVRLVQRSRFGLDAIESDSEKFPILGEDEMPDPMGQVMFEWSAEEFTDPDAPVVALVEPGTAMGENWGRFRRMLVGDPDQSIHGLTAEGQFECHRNVTGTVRRFGGAPILGADVSLRYAESIATQSTVLSSIDHVSCDSDADCGPYEACNPDEGTCGLDLTGVAAGEATSSDAGTIEAWVYSYCEDIPALERAFDINVAPSALGLLPAMNFRVDQELPMALQGQVPQAVLEADLCVPTWPESREVSFEVGAAPVRLATGADGAIWSCCDSSCLPGGEVLGDEAPFAPEVCTGYQSIRIATPVAMPDLDAWEEDGCLPPLADEDGVVGRFVRALQADDDCSEASCSLELPHSSDETLLFDITVLHPRTSVFRSRVHRDVEVDPVGKTIPMIEFEPRTLLKGNIVCDEGASDAGCEATQAVIIAERLRMDDEEGPLGPYRYWQVAHATSEDQDGEPRGAAFSMPVNPGVYVVTALPASGAGGGPARFRVVDARNGSDEVDETKVANLDDFVLEAGLATRLRLRDFDRGAQLIPLDTGSWNRQDDFTYPGSSEIPDLNDPQTCYTSGESDGCLIRSLIRPDVLGLSLLQSGRVEFTARDRGSRSCSDG